MRRSERTYTEGSSRRVHNWGRKIDSPISESITNQGHTTCIMGDSAPAPNQLLVLKCTAHATLPSSSPGAAGCALYGAYDHVVPARGKALVRTDIAIAVPEGMYARIAPRSGLAWKHHLQVANSVLDPGYRGVVGVVLFNHGHEDFIIHLGDHVAQLTLERHVVPEIVHVRALPAAQVVVTSSPTSPERSSASQACSSAATEHSAARSASSPASSPVPSASSPLPSPSTRKFGSTVIEFGCASTFKDSWRHTRASPSTCSATLAADGLW